MLNFKQFIREDVNVKQYAILQHNDLTKYGGDRIKVFLAKIKDSEKFATVHGLVTIDADERDRLSNEMSRSGFNTNIRAKIGNTSIIVKYPKDFYKSPEFGGKGIGAGTAAESYYLTAFRKELDAAFVRENEPVINLKIGDRVVRCLNVAKTIQTGSKEPKSDFSIIGENGKEVAWISHKAGTKPSDFQQYGGLTNSAFSRMTEITEFVDKVKELYPDAMTPGVTLYRKINSPKIINMSVYGIDFGNTIRNNDNIDEIHQGFMRLVKNGNYYSIESSHKGINGEIPTNGYAAYFLARYTSDVTYLGVKNSRVAVFPLGKIPKTAKEI